ncbi:MAG: RsmE family RNA methyltransferase [Pseudomonadota bacterium]|jgi:16S rRNA (uracil1498-N3)-methyltransferase
MAARYSSGPRLFVSNVRFCFSDPLPRRIELSSNEGHYLRDVLRLSVGTQIEVGDPSNGTIGLATIDSLQEPVSVVVSAWVQDQRPVERPITILCALCKGDKNEQICDWSTELGCVEIHFWQSPRSVVRLRSENDFTQRANRFQKIATAAAQQSKQPNPPRVTVHPSLATALGLITHLDTSSRYLCSLEPESRPLSEMCATKELNIPAVLAIGPEGDITPEERELFVNRAQFIPITLGPSVLRSELAVVSAIALIRAVDSVRGPLNQR